MQGFQTLYQRIHLLLADVGMASGASWSGFRMKMRKKRSWIYNFFVWYGCWGDFSTLASKGSAAARVNRKWNSSFYFMFLLTLLLRNLSLQWFLPWQIRKPWWYSLCLDKRRSLARIFCSFQHMLRAIYSWRRLQIQYWKQPLYTVLFHGQPWNKKVGWMACADIWLKTGGPWRKKGRCCDLLGKPPHKGCRPRIYEDNLVRMEKTIQLLYNIMLMNSSIFALW